MREIKYRGKTKSGDWIYGAYVAFEGLQGAIYFPIRHSKDNRVIKTDWVYVNPESVGQFTGLHDASGKEIYEGDILKGDSTIYEVTYNEKIGAFVLISKDSLTWLNMFQNLFEDLGILIVGNIIDNPELIN